MIRLFYKSLRHLNYMLNVYLLSHNEGQGNARFPLNLKIMEQAPNVCSKSAEMCKKCYDCQMLKKTRKRGHNGQSDFIDLRADIPLNTGLVQTHQSPVESAWIPALTAYLWIEISRTI
jgi:hypothetical protein